MVDRWRPLGDIRQWVEMAASCVDGWVVGSFKCVFFLTRLGIDLGTVNENKWIDKFVFAKFVQRMPASTASWLVEIPYLWSRTFLMIYKRKSNNRCLHPIVNGVSCSSGDRSIFDSESEIRRNSVFIHILSYKHWKSALIGCDPDSPSFRFKSCSLLLHQTWNRQVHKNKCLLPFIGQHLQLYKSECL